MCNNILIVKVISLTSPAWEGAKSVRACERLGKFANKSLCDVNLLSDLMSVEI
jgi:hypothetical protein